jgi:hypothetical protein
MTSHEPALNAVAVMTAWTDDPNNPQFMVEQVGTYLGEPDGDLQLIHGLVHVAGWLLVKLSECTDREMRDLLQECARRFA